MINMNHSEKVDMLFIYWECQKNARRVAQTYAHHFPSLLINFFMLL
jgi:hypothetical protein